MSTLYVFDIDGTLTKTNSVDEVCFSEVAKSLLNITDFKFPDDNTWHFTDSYISHKLLSTFNAPSLRDTFKQQFLESLRNTSLNSPDEFIPVKGGIALLQDMIDQKIPFALATGCWQESATIKLQAAGYTMPNAPISTADDNYTRYEIVTKAIIESESFYNTSFSNIVYIGDGVWDKITCARLMLPLIGIDAENNPIKAKALGKHLLLKSYPTINEFMSIATKATVPK